MLGFQVTVHQGQVRNSSRNLGAGTKAETMEECRSLASVPSGLFIALEYIKFTELISTFLFPVLPIV